MEQLETLGAEARVFDVKFSREDNEDTIEELEFKQGLVEDFKGQVVESPI